jgi:hypothetical protein
MAAGENRTISPQDLERTVCSVARHFGTDVVYIVGSQALLVARDDVAKAFRTSFEIDAYPANREQWETTSGGIEASEEINGLFGEGSPFHEAYGFFIDGVDESTAKLPPDWRKRAVERVFECGDGKSVTAIAPAPVEIVAAKLVRGDEKDVEFAARCMGAELVTNAAVRASLKKTVERALLTECLGRVELASKFKNDPSGVREALTVEAIDSLMARSKKRRP